MFRLLIHWLLCAIALLIVVHFVFGFYVIDMQTAMVASAVIGLLNATLGFFMKVITFPLAIVTFGLFLVFVNAAMIMLAAKMVNGFQVYGWTPAIRGAIVLSILGMLIRLIMRDE